ncbi:aldo/keto reductase [Microbacterium esteraromaticum]|uniref:aldo/keto reductase n=1 Tax=Microbacterium esteraromaticum TaxID=57043 RepID=UPI00195AD5EC|nr:aldo/keto reductase [Microbacterium esteraromaticum]MBM7465691.1 2,5-diketo-D-gluconate reductase A [Microbacterium esteraromaticum]
MPASFPLADGTRLPALGFGLYKVPVEQTAEVALAAIEAGYRLVDGAQFYRNERELGEAIRESGRRDQLLVASKFWGDPVQSRAQALADFAQSEHDLGIGPLDLYLIHWPRSTRGTFVEVWRGLIELQQEGRVRTIGVANFEIDDLRRLIDDTGVAPALNQVESHPWLPQHELRAFHSEHGIVTQAWSPLGRGRLLDDPTLAGIAAKHSVSVAQVILRWHLQLGGAAVVKSVHPDRLRQNLDLDGFDLDADDLTAVAALETGERTGTHPRDRQ